MKQIKRGLAIFLALAMMMSSLSIGGVDVQAATKKKGTVQSVTITKPDTKTLVLKKGQTFTIKAAVKTSDKKVSKAVTWTSSNKKVATVNSKGKIKALKNGKTTITVKSKTNKKKKATLKIIVKTPVKKVTLDKTSVTLIEGETADLKATVLPANATKKDMAYKSSDESVATVNNSGRITAVKAGKATITATAQDGNGKKATCAVTVNKKAAPAVKPTEPDKPEPVETLDRTGYELEWEDEFEGVSLNSADWNVEIHEPGWVNNEWQAYVNSPDNIKVEGGELILKPVRKTVSANADVIENGDATYTYTSGRVNTQGNHDFTYGLFECRAKVPTGKGYLPAFWMMPTDENLYGQWPRCGEIDIMEVMGQEIDKVYGTIHYGNPHGQKQDTMKLATGNFANEYHDFAVEWEPGRITWYVDGVKYHEANDWYSKDGQSTVSYPAPFDQPFYMILNLAIGGDWVGYPDETTTYDDQEFAIDYVRVSRKDQSYYDELEATAEKPVKPPVTEPADDKYISNGDFSAPDDFTGKSNWEFKTAQGGKGTAAIVSDTKFGTGVKAVKISTEAAGTEDYSIQLVQAKVPLKQGNSYTVSFDAYAESNRTMIVDVSAPDLNYARYLADTTVNLTTEKQTFSYPFDMTSEDDANGRLEFNLGATDSKATVYITNVKIEKGEPIEIDTGKKVQADGNYISNGKFQETATGGKKNMLDWTVEDKTEKASYGVTALSDRRKFYLTSEDCVSANDVVLKQTGLPLVPGKYEFSLKGMADKEGGATINVKVGGHTEQIALTNTYTDHRFKLAIAEGTDKDLIIELGVNCKVTLDDISLVEDTLIKNGSFNAGLASWEPYYNSPAKVSYVVDSLNEANAFDITISDTGDKDWHIQLKQNNVAVTNGQWYKLSFDIKSDMARKVSYAIQRNGAVHKKNGEEDWTPYVQKTIELVKDNENYTHIEEVFQMKEATDTGSIFNVTMGAVGGTRIQKQHRICIDNIVLEETEAPKESPILDQFADVNLLNNPTFTSNGTGWVPVIAEDGAGTWTFADDKAKVAITNPGSEDWNIGLKQENLKLIGGEEYVVTATITSDVARSGKFGCMDSTNKNWYVKGDNTITLEAGTATPVTFTVGTEETDKTAYIAFNFGKIDDTTPKASNITIENVSLKRTAKPGEIVQPEGVNLLSNPNFASGETGWAPVIAGSAAGTWSFADNQAQVTITNPGSEDWNVGLKKEGLTLVAGETYEITATITSDVARSGKFGCMDSTSKNWYVKDDNTITLEANTAKKVTFTVSAAETDKTAYIAFNFGKIDDTTPTASVVTIKNVSLKRIVE